MDEQIKEYSNGEVTIVWKPHLCIHSENCFRGLPRVFNPKRKPWIDAGASGTQAIVEQVGKCPSGALSTYMNAGKGDGNGEPAPSITQAEVIPKGPLKVSGPVAVKMSDGSEVIREKATFFCRCGQSANKPFCDGTHRKISFEEE